MAAPLRLADLLAGLSMVSDLGFALPPGEAIRRCLLATSLARGLGLEPSRVSDVFYTALLEHIGCTGYAHETSVAYGDELAFNAAIARSDTSHLAGALAFAAQVTAGRPPGRRVRGLLFTILRGDRFGRGFATATCEVGRETARRLGLGDDVQRGLEHVVETWDGSQGARGVRGEAIDIAARVTVVASTASLVADLGADAVREVLQRQAGRQLDPAITTACSDQIDGILAELEARDPLDAVLDAEPTPHRTISPPQLIEVAAAIGHVADLKSTFTVGHSSGVASLAVAAGERLGWEAAALARLEVAALLHDVGRVGISNAVWERAGPLTKGDWEQVRLHAYHSERILARSEGLRALAPLVGMHHERLDGSGYHRGARGGEVPREARVLAAADALDAMTHERPHRPARSPSEAARELGAEVRAGRLDAEATDAVVTAATLVPGEGRRTRIERAAGLSEREVEVLRLMSRGLSNRDIAERLVVSTRTAEHHVQHIYTKIGVSSRAAAALFAMEHALLD
jgi:HD-GYP domain-containing protein (c-di-GMP phosphodiesterase class II)